MSMGGPARVLALWRDARSLGHQEALRMTKINHWLMKSEPDVYSYDDLVAEGEGTWDGVRNHRAANNLRAMQVGEQAFSTIPTSGWRLWASSKSARRALPTLPTRQAAGPA
jgi:hypothetical protein